MTKKRILVVDDNVSNLKLFTFLLSNPDYEVRTASDADEALGILNDFHPHLMLLDLQLPGMDGLSLTRKLKAEPATRDLPIYAVTAYAMKGDEERAREAGVDGYISKPIDKNSFRAIVAEALRDK